VFFRSTTNARTPIKSFKDEDFHLECFKDTKIDAWDWNPGPDDVGQKKPKPIPNMKSPTKNLKSKSSQYFLVETRRLSESFQGLNSSLAQSAGEL